MNSSSPLNLVAAVMLLMFVPGLLFLGVVGAISETGTMRLVFMMLAASAAAMGIGGVQMIVKWRRASKHEAEHQRAIRAAVGAPPVAHPAASAAPVMPAPAARTETVRAAPPAAARARAESAVEQAVSRTATVKPSAAPAPGPAARTLPTGEPVLAHWTYTADEWSAYTRSEWKGRIIEAFAVGIGVFLLGLLIGRNEPEGVAVAGSGMFALILIVGRLMIARSARHSNQRGPREAIVTPTAIVLNGRYHVLSNDHFRFEGVRYVEDKRPPLLEFTVGWSTRGGRTNNQVNVPIPAGREAEAREIVAAFQRGWAVEV